QSYTSFRGSLVVSGGLQPAIRTYAGTLVPRPCPARRYNPGGAGGIAPGGGKVALVSRVARVPARRPAHHPERPPGLTGVLARIAPKGWALLAILAGALLLRLLALGAFSAEYDEGVYWLTLRAMAGGRPLYTAIYNAQAPFFFPSLYPVFLLFGQTLLGAR